MSASIFSRGRPVYGGGSFAPNKGQVSAQGAQGYLQREIKKQGPYGGVSKFGSDGQSDTRSGVAAKKIRAGFGTTPIKQNDGSNSGWLHPVNPDPGSPTQQQPQPQPNTPGTPENSQQPTPEPQQPPQVVINSTGQLELPYNQQFSDTVLAALDQYNSDLLTLQSDQQTEGMDYAKNRRDAGIKFEDLGRATLSNNAARGTAFSSGYGVAVAKNAREYLNQLNDMDTKHSQFAQMSDLKRSSIITAFQRMLAQAAMQSANDAAGNAGDYGYGDNPEGSGETPATPIDPTRQTMWDTPIFEGSKGNVGSTGPKTGGTRPPIKNPVLVPIRNNGGKKKPPKKGK